jgi:hypothetical protein
MKKTMSTLASAILSAAIAAIPMSGGISSSAVNKGFIDDLTMYYDLNNDNEVNVSDLVIGMSLLDEGKISKNDTDNIYSLMFNEEIEMGFEEIDLDTLEVTPENIKMLQTYRTCYCGAYSSDETGNRWRYLNDGVITEIRCSYCPKDDADAVIEPIDFWGSEFKICGNRFAISYPGYCFCHYNFDSLVFQSADEVRRIFDKAGDLKKFDLDDNKHLKLYFRKGSNEHKTIDLELFAKCEEPICSFEYNGTEVYLGLTSQHHVAISEIRIKATEEE